MDSATQPASSPLRVAVIIPALHRPDLTSRCVDSVLKQPLPLQDYEIIVAENDAARGPILPDPLPPRVRRLLLTQNFGFTGAVNRGIASSSSRYVLLLNNDVELAPDFVKLLLDRMESTPLAGIAGGKLLSATDHTILDGAADALLMGGGAYRLGHGDPDTGRFAATKVLACCGAALLVRRSVLDELGGLDEHFFAYLDDVDLALRARLRGYQVIYVPEASAFHAGSATLGEPLHPKMVEWMTRNQLFLLIKNYPASLVMRLLPRICLYQLLWFSRVVRENRLPAYLRGLRGALKLFPAMWHARRHIQRTRSVSSRELLTSLRESENQIVSWQESLPPQRRSELLSAYFLLCGRARMH